MTKKKENKHIYRRQIRTFYIINPKVVAIKSVLDIFSKHEKYEIHLLKRFVEMIESLEEVSYEDIPLEVFKEYYNFIGRLNHLKNDYKLRLSEMPNYSVEYNKRTVKLIDDFQILYEEYINSVIKKI